MNSTFFSGGPSEQKADAKVIVHALVQVKIARPNEYAAGA